LEFKNLKKRMKHMSGIPFNQTNSPANSVSANSPAQALSLQRDEQRPTNRTCAEVQPVWHRRSKDRMGARGRRVGLVTRTRAIERASNSKSAEGKFSR
jgi:hypothetical protein